MKIMITKKRREGDHNHNDHHRSLLTGESGCDASGARHSCSITEIQRFERDDDDGIPHICHFFSTYTIFGSIFFDAKTRKS